jgi:hypothetical protein
VDLVSVGNMLPLLQRVQHLALDAFDQACEMSNVFFKFRPIAHHPIGGLNVIVGEKERDLIGIGKHTLEGFANSRLEGFMIKIWREDPTSHACRRIHLVFT